MTINDFVFKVKLKIKNTIVYLFFQYPRVLFYSFLSSIKVAGIKLQPLLSNGIGKIKIGENVTFGVKESPYYYSGYSYIDARKKDSYIEIGDNCFVNNNATIISDGKKIIIGKNCLIGTNFEITDSNFHDLSAENRFGGKNIIKKDVTIEENVFIGNNVTILKGVIIGKNSVIGNSSVVTKDIPQNSIAVGNPAKVIKQV
ncbi:MAG: Galactoside O-acetyltransferase [uncultured Sulfurimonas sp.]|nr:MAG: Galactoside O-acetyltransferase [uncultured Sulfurimonas sp.]